MLDGRLRVLVVESDAGERETVRAVLSEQYAVEFVAGAREAIEAVQTMRPQLIVSELDLIDGDGLGLCEQLRALPGAEHLPIMLLTRRASIHDKVAGFQAGADDYVVKPLDARLFPARIRLLCRIKGIEHPQLGGKIA